MKYANESEILSIVASFERGTISRKDWHHAEHLTVSLYYLSKYDYETALTKMRVGIFNLLKSFGIDLTVEMPYHETLTVFWMQTVYDFKNAKTDLPMLEIHNDLVEKFGKDYPLRFYSRELLYSNEARKNYVSGDIETFR